MNLPGLWSIPCQRQVAPRSMVILEVARQDPKEMDLIQNHYVIEAFPANVQFSKRSFVRCSKFAPCDGCAQAELHGRPDSRRAPDFARGATGEGQPERLSSPVPAVAPHGGRSLRSSEILVEGMSARELLELPTVELDALLLRAERIVFSVGTAEVLASFRVRERSLTVELGHIDGGGDDYEVAR
jgi:hypothetical protein